MLNQHWTGLLSRFLGWLALSVVPNLGVWWWSWLAAQHRVSPYYYSHPPLLFVGRFIIIIIILHWRGKELFTTWILLLIIIFQFLFIIIIEIIILSLLYYIYFNYYYWNNNNYYYYYFFIIIYSNCYRVGIRLKNIVCRTPPFPFEYSITQHCTAVILYILRYRMALTIPPDFLQGWWGYFGKYFSSIFW